MHKNRLSSPLMAVVVLVLMGLTFGSASLNLMTRPQALHAQSQPDVWQMFVDADAGYSFQHPAESTLETSSAAGLAYDIVYVQFPITSTGAYQGVSVMVLENPSNQNLRTQIAEEYAAAKVQMPFQTQLAVGHTVAGREAIKLTRDPVAGDYDKYSVFVQGDGVIYRINLFGGGIGGEIEPTTETEAMFERLVQSFRVLGTAPRPRPVSTLQSQAQTQAPASPLQAPVATVFTYPLRSGVSLGYGVPTGIVVGGTRMEWLDYGIRNLDQWRTKCYGVDWSRMIHTGEDWYRNDYLTANTAGSPVYAVADGVVARHDAGISYPGNVVLIKHWLPDGRNIYSMYGHISNVTVVQGQQVKLGQQIATVLNQGYVGRTPAKHPSWDAHLHFEMRYIEHAGNIYVSGTNAYGYNYPGCTYAYPGRGYTYIIHPNDYPYPNAGYVDGSEFIAARLSGGGGCTPQELLANGNFEQGRTLWTATNSAGANDPLIYTTRPRTGRWGGWLGNRVSYEDTLAQVVRVGKDTQLSLKFWRYVQSKEAAGNADDKMVIGLYSADGAPLVQQEAATSASARNVWALFETQFDLAGYAHSTAVLRLQGQNDGDNVSSFFIDEVSLVQQCPAVAGAATEAIAAPSPITPTQTLSQIVALPVVLAAEAQAEAPPDKQNAPLVCANVLSNGDFEAPLALPWTGIANTPSVIYNVIPGSTTSNLKDDLLSASRSRSGFKSGRVGSPITNGYWTELLQTAQLPKNVSSVTLTYWRYLETSETTTTTRFDKFEVGIESEKGIQLVPPHKTDNLDARKGQWVQESLALPNAATYGGQKLWVTFKGNLDNTRPSSFYVDDVELVVCGA